MNYYLLRSVDQGEGIFLKKISPKNVFLTTGSSIEIGPSSLPFYFEMYIDEEFGYAQYDPDYNGSPEFQIFEDRLKDFYCKDSLISERMLNAFKNVNIKNFQTFPTNIIDIQTNTPLQFNYYIINILDLISCANMNLSEYHPLGNCYHFTNLIIDKSKIQNQLIFRVAESPYEIVISEKMCELINFSHFKGIKLEKLMSS